MSNRAVVSSVAVLLVLHFAIILFCIKANSPTCDEIAHHVASGYSYLTTRDFRMNPANPPLIREISAIPLLFLNLRSPVGLQSWIEGNSPVFGRQFFYELNKNADKIIFWARVPVAMLSVVLGFLIFLWSSSLYGQRGGILSLALYSFSPNIIAHAGLATVDLGATLFIFASVFSFWIFLKNSSVKNLVICAIALGLAQASKYTSIFLIPIFILLGAFFYSRKSNGKMALDILSIFLISTAVLFASYAFEIKPLIKNAPDVPEKIEYIKSFVDKLHLDRIGLNKERALWLAGNQSMPFSAYLIGLGGVIHQNAIGGYHSFLLGKVSESGFWDYFLVAFLTKSTLPTIILFIASLLLLIRTDGRSRKDALFLLIPIAVLFIVASMNKGQVGIRHILPIYPFIFVLIGSISMVPVKKIIGIFIFAVVVVLQAASLMTAFPYPIAYFNEIAGGPDNGYNILRDSNLDWGQGLKALKVYLDKNNIDRIKLCYFGTADPAYYKINFEIMNEKDSITPGSGIYAISAQYLGNVKWVAKHKPIAKVAHSIFIYKI